MSTDHHAQVAELRALVAELRQQLAEQSSLAETLAAEMQALRALLRASEQE